MILSQSHHAVNVPPDCAKFLMAMFSPEDFVLFRQIESWTEGGKKQDDFIEQCHKRFLFQAPSTNGTSRWHPIAASLIGQQLAPMIRRAEDEKGNIYVGVAPRFGNGGRYDEAWQIRKIPTLWADVDNVADVREVVDRLKAAGVPHPSMAICSGGGFHLYWLLDEPFLISDCGKPAAIVKEWVGDSKGRKLRKWIVFPDDGERVPFSPATRQELSPQAQHVQDIVQGLAKTIGSDHVHDLSRIMRLPGTLNRKDERNGRTPRSCTLIRYEPECRYPLKDFERFAEKSEDRRRREQLAKVKLPTVRKLSGKREDTLNELVLECQLADVGQRSEVDFHLCCRAVEIGVSPDEVWSRVADIGKFRERGREYFDRTWEKAEGHTREQILQKKEAEITKKAATSLNGQATAWIGDDEGDIKYIADLISRDHRFAQDEGGKLYAYKDGAYRRRGDEFVRRLVKRKCNEAFKTERWSPSFADSVVEYIRVDSPLLWERPPLDMLNVKNGLLRLSDRVLLPHSSDHLSPIQLPVAFDPAASCPAVEKFVNEVFPPDATQLAWEITAWLMRPDTSIQKAVLLTGPGGNGKSVWLRLLTKFLGGKENTSGLSLHKLEADKFAASRLYGKLANICPDLPSEHLAGTSVFKAVTGGDTIVGEYKFKDSFDFVPYARLVFSANSLPRSEDSSQGFFDRWLVIPFDRSFRGTAAEIPSRVLDAQLQAPSELSGLLNMAVDAVPRIGGRCGFAVPASVQAAWREFQATTDPLAVWLDRYTVDDPDMYVVKKLLRVAFNAYLEQQGRPAMTDKAFASAFSKHRPNVETKQRTVNGRVQWCYVGIGTLQFDREPDSDASHLSQGSQGSPSLFQSHAENRLGGECESTGEQDRANPVNPVNPVSVNGDCRHEYTDRVEGDSIVTKCVWCGKFFGKRPASEADGQIF